MSTDLGYKTKKCLVKSGKDIIFLAAVVSTVYCPKKYPYLFGQVTYIEIENHLRWIARVFLGGFF